MGSVLVLLLLVSIVAIVVASSVFHLHPFVSLILSSLFLGLGAAALGEFSVLSVEATIREGFGAILVHIGIVIVLGTIIGVFLEKSGGAVKIADTIIRTVGPRRPELAMSIIGWIVSIPVFCDSGFIILNAMRKSVTRRTKTGAAGMSVALATGLYASHTLVPPTPGPIAAAGNLGLEDHIGVVVLFGLFVSLVPMIVGHLWAVFIGKRVDTKEDRMNREIYRSGLDAGGAVEKTYGKLPSAPMSFAPIVVPILLIGLGAVAMVPDRASELGLVSNVFLFLGRPFIALFIGLLCALSLAPKLDEEVMMKWIGEGIRTAGPIILITGAGGAFGAIIKATSVAAYLGSAASGLSLGILVPFVMAAALKTAQGSTTTTMVATSALISPLLLSLGLESTIGSVLAVMSIGAGAMVVSHANDSYFWVVAEFTGMDIRTAYRSQTLATAIQGVATMMVVFVLSLILI